MPKILKKLAQIASNCTLSSHYSTLLRKSQYLALLFLFLPLFLAAPAHASSNSFYFDSYTADYYLTRDADNLSHLKVVETYNAVFPNYNQNHGFNRLIPYTLNDGQSSALPKDGLNFSVTRNGRPENINNVEKGKGYYEYQIGDPVIYVLGEQTYVLKYEFQNVILNHTVNANGTPYSFDELNWDANGNDSAQKYNRVTARLHLENGLQIATDPTTSKPQVNCFVGVYGSDNTDSCTISQTSDGYEFTAANLKPKEGLTFAVAFPDQTFKILPPNYNFTAIVLLILTTLGALALLVYAFRRLAPARAKAKAYKNTFTKPEYTPPHNFTIGEMSANYIGKHQKGSPMVATLLELAVTHKIEIIKLDEDKTKKKSIFASDPAAWKIRVLAPHDLHYEQVLVLQIMARSDKPLEKDQEILVDPANSQYSSALAKIASRYDTRLDNNLVTYGLRAKDDTKKSSVSTINGRRVRSKLISDLMPVVILTPFAGFLIILLSCIFLENSDSIVIGYDLIFPVVFLEMIILFITGVGLVSHYAPFSDITDKGLEYSKYLDGLYEYIKLAEADRLKLLQSVEGADLTHQGIVKLYEKLLPYASLFGLEKSWLQELNRYYEMDDVPDPLWIATPAILSSHSFDHAISSLTSAAGTSIAHSTSNSSSSSSSGSFGGGGGGGFSGGGGGGGGTSGW